MFHKVFSFLILIKNILILYEAKFNFFHKSVMS